MTNTIITLTPAAVSHLQQKIKAKKAVGFRLSVKASGCSGFRYVPELVTDVNDADIAHEFAPGLMVYIDPKAVLAIEGTKIDLEAKDLGLKQMVYHNPRAENHCGCGESFSIKQEDDNA